MDFNISEERKKWELPDKEFEQNVNDIFNELCLMADSNPSPTFVLVGGQAGSGKSGLVSKKYQELQGNAIIIDQDELRTKFPVEKYKQILEKYTEREEFLILNPYIAKLIQTIIEKAKSENYNIVLESALQDVAAFEKNTIDLKNNGYRTELAVMSVPEIEANISMLTRYCYYLEKDGFCRRNTRINPNALPNIRKNIANLDNQNIFDNIEVYIRGNSKNELPTKIYSKLEKQYDSPIHAFDAAQMLSLKATQSSFHGKYNEIKSILIAHNETSQLKKLEDIKTQFEKSLEGVEL